MDIFKALTHGDGSINEPNTTSFLYHILTQDLEPFGRGVFKWFLYNCGIVGCDDVDFNVTIEHRVGPRDVDLIITFSNQNNEEYALLIENKIKTSSDLYQCAEQYENYSDHNVNVYSILLCPDHDSFNIIFEVLREINTENSHRLNWGVNFDNDNNLVSVLNVLLVGNAEQNHIKSFINFIIRETNQFNASTYEIADTIDLIVNRDLNGKITVVDDNGVNYRVDGNNTVLAMLRYIIFQFDLQVNLLNRKGSSKNTQTLGTEVIGASNDMNNVYYM